jgi:hypothetical protein
MWELTVASCGNASTEAYGSRRALQRLSRRCDNTDRAGRVGECMI